MSVFNNITYTLTDAEKFALICGMLLGLRLQDKTQPPQTLEMLTEPASLGGDDTIGIKVASVATDGPTMLRVPVSVKDVNIGYSGYTFLLKYPTNLCTVTSVQPGPFGAVTDYYIDTEAGEVYAYSILPPGTEYTQPMVLCYLYVTVTTQQNWLNIPLNLENGNFYDTNYCTLLKYVDNNLFFITPLSNQSGKILNNRGGDSGTAMPETEMINRLLPALQDSGRGATASPSMIALGTAVISNLSTFGVMAIYVNTAEDSGFYYNKFHLKVKLRREDLDEAAFVQAIGIDGWGFTTEITYDSEDNQYLEIVGERTTELIGNCTAGYIKFRTEANESTNIIVHNLVSEIINTITSETQEVIRGDGRICLETSVYLAPIESSSSTGWGSGAGSGTIATVPQGQTPTEADTNTAQKMQGSTGGGTEMTGQIYTDTEQVMEVDMGDGNKSFVYLEPGWNDIHLIIPTIYGRTKWVSNLTPKVKTSGYVLIPAGFNFRTFNNKAVRKGLSSPHLLDKFSFSDIYDVLKIERPVNTDIEEFNIQDFAALTKIEIQKKILDYLDEFEIEDDYDITVDSPVVPITADDILDEFNIEDFSEQTQQRVTIIAQNLIEEFGIDDVLDVLVYSPPVPITADDIDDEVTVEDLATSEKISVIITQHTERETFSIEDVIAIE